MRSCVIFNPTARGNKASRFRQRLETLSRQCSLKPTPGPGTAIALAASAVREGFDTIVAAGGDGTVNEVVNGMALEPGGLDRTRLGILPFGTINVFAKELGLPADLDSAWEAIQRGRELKVDLPWVEFPGTSDPARRCFVQLAGAGLDSRAIGFVDWKWKTRIGPLAYAVAGLRAMWGPQPRVIVELPDGQRAEGELALVGNGTLYGGWVRMFPHADLHDGRLEIRVLPQVDLATLARFGWSWLARHQFTVPGESVFRAERFVVSSLEAIPFELDGDNVGQLPATFSVQRDALRVLVP